MFAAAFALGLTAMPGPPPAAAPAPAATAPIELTIPQLRALIGRPETAAAARLMGAGGYSLACAPASAGAAQASCRFARTFGQVTVHPTFELASRVRLRELRLETADGRIAGIAFRASPDDYDKVRILLDKAYGEPKLTRDVVRTELGPRDQVKLVWGASGRVSRLVDPAPPDLGLVADLHG
jgi:hypothetical protein